MKKGHHCGAPFLCLDPLPKMMYTNYMNIIRIVLPIIALIVGGCATINQTKPQITSDGWLVVGARGHVAVHVHERTEPFHKDKLIVYDVRLVNDNKYPVCAKPMWRLVDLDNQTVGWEFISANTVKETGQLVQQPWIYGQTYLLVPPSGMVYDLRVVKAVIRKDGYDCVDNDE